jgi:ATP-dependent DNA helicase RecG
VNGPRESIGQQILIKRPELIPIQDIDHKHFLWLLAFGDSRALGIFDIRGIKKRECLPMPIHNPCDLLARLLQEPAESGWLEFKTNNSDPHEIGEYVSALANAAMLAGRDRAFLVFGVKDGNREKVGTRVRLLDLKKGGENLSNWLSRIIEPRIMLDIVDFECDGVPFSIIAIEPTYDRPVRFDGTEYLRIGENKKKLIDFPEHERSLWLATGRRKFEDAVALSNQSVDQVLEKLDKGPLFELTGDPEVRNPAEIIRKMVERCFLLDNLEGRFDVTNLGAILLARSVKDFPTIAGNQSGSSSM